METTMMDEIPGRAQAGFTIAELLVYLVVSLIVLTGAYQLLIGENRIYSKNREIRDVQQTLRSASSLLTWELRHVSPTGGDLPSISANAVTLRSIQATGVVCAMDKAAGEYALWAAAGEFYAESEDSVLIFASGARSSGDDDWNVLNVTDLQSPAVAGLATCTWGNGLTPDTVILAVGDTAGIRIGAPVRTFRRASYELYEADGRWWLGRRVGAESEPRQLTGPLSSPGDGGLALTFYGPDGAPTTDPRRVRQVEVVIRGESFGKLPSKGGAEAERDSVATRLKVRG